MAGDRQLLCGELLSRRGASTLLLLPILLYPGPHCREKQEGDQPGMTGMTCTWLDAWHTAPATEAEGAEIRGSHTHCSWPD